MAISHCNFPLGLAAGRQLIRYDTTVTCVGPTGHSIPGGFGWLSQTPGTCSVDVDVADPQTPVTTGNNFPSNCVTQLQTMKNETVLIPLYEQYGLSGSNGWYKNHGFAAFHVEGWKIRRHR